MTGAKSSLVDILKHLVENLPPKRVDALLIGVSTGGPEALSTLVSLLDERISCPIFVVIHMREGFSESFIDQLKRRTKIAVCEATDNAVAKGATIYIAPPRKHMYIKYNKDQTDPGMYRIYLDNGEEVNSCKPSVDVLFDSAAEIANENMVGLIMTGIGHDGAMGAANLYKKGKGYIIIQDEESSVVWGMPKTTLLKNCVSEVLPLNMLGARLNKLIMSPRQ